mmetsp:Transcript_96270/g.233919  ORF Transcript_96270/g.233919 Transcript_96270/m.233919 type:complete len:225 (-) Transcript_96270:468-1142(-)
MGCGRWFRRLNAASTLCNGASGAPSSPSGTSSAPSAGPIGPSSTSDGNFNVSEFSSERPSNVTASSKHAPVSLTVVLSNVFCITTSRTFVVWGASSADTSSGSNVRSKVRDWPGSKRTLALRSGNLKWSATAMSKRAVAATTPLLSSVIERFDDLPICRRPKSISRTPSSPRVVGSVTVMQGKVPSPERLNWSRFVLSSVPASTTAEKLAAYCLMAVGLKYTST